MNKARQFADRGNAVPIDLAEALWEAEQAEPGSVRRITEEGRARLKYRRARYLLDVWDRFATLGIPREVLIWTGWTKLALIARYSEPGAEKDWLELARPGGCTAKQLEDRLKGRADDRPKGHSILLRLSPAQHRTFVRTLIQYGAKVSKNGRGLAGKERALTRALRELAGRPT